jgi:osmotically-inducible protein OsmY
VPHVRDGLIVANVGFFSPPSNPLFKAARLIVQGLSLGFCDRSRILATSSPSFASNLAEAIQMRLSLLLALTMFLGSQPSFGQNDESIQANVQKALSVYSIKSIHSSVQSGVVTLTGSVDLCRTKILADELTSGIRGVKSIWDRVEVSGPTVPDKELGKEIKNLIADRIRRLGGFGFGSISAQVHDGVVTLRGYAAPQLALPTRAAVADIPGVKNLIEHIKLVPPVEPHWQTSFEVGGESSQ